MDIRLVRFFYFFELSRGAFDTKYLGPNQVEPRKKLGPIISQKIRHDTPKVYEVTVCTDEGGKSQVFSAHLVKTFHFYQKTQRYICEIQY